MDLDVEGIVVLLPHDTFDAGHGGEPLLQADERLLAIRVERSVARIDVEAHLEEAIGVGLRGQATQVRAHLQQQRAHAQERGLREGDLSDHQPGLEPQAPRDHDAGRVLQRLLQRQTSGVQRRRQSEQHTSDESQAERERDIAPVDLDREVRNAGIEQTEEQPDHEQPQRAGGHRQRRGLGHELPDDAAPPGAEGEPHCDLAPARDAETGEQRADVGAGDQQDEHRKDHGDHGAGRGPLIGARWREVVAGDQRDDVGGRDDARRPRRRLLRRPCGDRLDGRSCLIGAHSRAAGARARP